jgi:DNA-binding response OmpR family regulator
MHGRILLVEHDVSLNTPLSSSLQAEGYEVEIAPDGDSGYESAASGGFDLILLQVMLPDRSGFDICRSLRREGIQTPLVMLSPRGETVEKVLGLKIGADEFLTIPFETMELLARIEALLRRTGSGQAPSAEAERFGEIQVDFRKTQVVREGEPVRLTAKEFQLLRYLLGRRGETVPRDELLKEVWGYDPATTSRTVDVHIAWLRQKLEDNPKQPQWIKTVHGFGYMLAG